MEIVHWIPNKNMQCFSFSFTNIINLRFNWLRKYGTSSSVLIDWETTDKSIDYRSVRYCYDNGKTISYLSPTIGITGHPLFPNSPLNQGFTNVSWKLYLQDKAKIMFPSVLIQVKLFIMQKIIYSTEGPCFTALCLKAFC